MGRSLRGDQEGTHLPPLRHLLLGMNAHINFDLPKSLLAVITDDEFDDDAVVARRAVGHARVDQLLVDRVKPSWPRSRSRAIAGGSTGP